MMEVWDLACLVGRISTPNQACRVWDNKINIKERALRSYLLSRFSEVRYAVVGRIDASLFFWFAVPLVRFTVCYFWADVFTISGRCFVVILAAVLLLVRGLLVCLVGCVKVWPCV